MSSLESHFLHWFLSSSKPNLGRAPSSSQPPSSWALQHCSCAYSWTWKSRLSSHTGMVLLPLKCGELGCGLMPLNHQVTCDSTGSCVQQARWPLLLANFEQHLAQSHAWKFISRRAKRGGNKQTTMSKKSPLGAHLTKNLRRAPLFGGTLTAYNSG